MDLSPVKYQSVQAFRAGKQYSRKDVYRVLGLPENTKGGNWDTGYSSHGPDFFIFCGVGTPGRTGHDYGNHFEGDRLIWYGKTGTTKNQPMIQKMLNPEGRVYVFFREDARNPFTFAGLATPHSVFDQVPVKVIWNLSAGPEDRLPSQLPEELDDELTETFLEGARRTISVNVYERDPNARRKCIAHWGLKCSICKFDFASAYGELGEGFIHVHHLTPLGDIREQYELNPVTDLRPVCPNCHAMLHRRRPALGIEELKQLFNQESHFNSMKPHQKP